MSRRKGRILRYVTSPCYYVNGSPHPGHLYTNILTSRIAWQLNYPIINGLDCHGRKVREKAETKGLSTVGILVSNGLLFKREFLKNIRTTDYIFAQTHSKKHMLFVDRIWRYLFSKDYIYRDYYEGYYSIQDETFLTNHKEGAILVKEMNYFLNVRRLWRKVILGYCKGRIRIYPGFYLGKVFEFAREIRNFCISRNEKWGIPVPGCTERTIHVWFDALLYYLSSIDYQRGDKVRFVQVIGKDILSFHSWHWIMMLEALDIDYRVLLIVHGWLLTQGEKISKSLIHRQKLTSDLNCDDTSHFFLNSRTIGLDISNLSKDQSVNLFRNSFVNLINRSLKILRIHRVSWIRNLRVNRRSLMSEISLIQAYNRFVSKNKLWITSKENRFKVKNLLAPYVIYLLISLPENSHLRHLIIDYNDGLMINWIGLNRLSTTFSRRW